MISIEKMRVWEKNDYDQNLNMIVVGFDPEMKMQYINNSGFDIDCKISDKAIFVDILCEIISLYIGSKFTVKLKDEKFSWLPLWLKQEFNDYFRIEKYLNNVKWGARKYFGSFQIKEVKEFLTLFIDYPLKYEYQDIELFSEDSNYVIVISYHGTVWIITDESRMLNKIALFLDSKGATVFPQKYIEQ